MRRTLSVAIALFFAPAAALAFETVDTLPYPSLGRFPAYPPEEPRPVNLFVEGGLMHDTNVLRRQGGGNYDNIMRMGAGIFYDQRVYGRQSIHLEARGDQYLFDNFSTLNHFAYNGGAEWRWEIGNDLSGTLGYAHVHRLAALAETQSATKRMINSDDLVGTGAYRLGPQFRLRGAYFLSHNERITPGIDDLNVLARTYTVGIDWVSPLGNAIGLEHRRSWGDAPVSPTIDPAGQFVGNDYNETENALVTTWVAGTSLSFTGRFGYTERSYTDLAASNFSDYTYRAGVIWSPTAKTSITFDAYHEPRSVIDLDASHAILTGTAIGPAWAINAKNVLSLRLVNERRHFIAGPSIDPAQPTLDETLRLMRFGWGWEPQRYMLVGFGLDRGVRESNTFNRNYNYTAVMANIRVTW
jgi:hypothetical protein